MLLSGNPVTGFGIPPRGQEAPVERSVGLGLPAQFLDQIASTQIQVPVQPATGPSIAQEAHQAVTGNEATPATTGSGTAMVCDQGPACSTTWNGVCTSDGNLEFLNGAWHVASVQTGPSAVPCSSTIGETSQQIITTWKGYPIYVGPFPADFLGNPNGQITNLTSPTQIGATWGAWLAQQDITSMLRTLTTQAQAGHAVNVVPFTQLLPLVVGQTQWLDATGAPLDPRYIAQPGQGAAGTDGQTILAEIANALQLPANAVPQATFSGNILPQVGPFPYPNGVPALNASGGHALFPNKAWTQADANGNLQTFVQYENDPNTYSYYSVYSWLNALSPLYSNIGLSLQSQTLTPSLLSNYDAMQNGPLPIAKFKNPLDSSNWGLWVTASSIGSTCLMPDGSQCPSSPSSVAQMQQFTSVPAEGLWNTSIDEPNGSTFQIGIAPIPQETFWDEVLDVLEWIPTELGDAIWTVAGWMSTFVCALAGQTSMLNSIPKNNPAAMAAALGALAIANAAQCNGPQIDCSQAAYALNPQCQPQPVTVPVTTTPWYLQWWVLLAAAVGVVALLAPKKKRSGPNPDEAPIEIDGVSGPREPPPVIPRKGPPPGVPIHPAMLKGSRRRRR